MSVYYAHPVNLYDTEQEKADLVLIDHLFSSYDIINPNSPKHRYCYLKEGMNYFVKLIEEEAIFLFFRALPDGKITAGVQLEIDTALLNDIPILELPYFENRALSVEETRARVYSTEKE